jgi:chaperone required for assembly of F1-ATPase
MKFPERIETTDIRTSDGIYTVIVNEEPLRTPKGHAVQTLSWDLANAMADELMAEGIPDLQRLNLYTLYATQRDFIDDRIDATIGAVLQHLAGDFVLHPDAEPTLAARQLRAWAPLLGFLRDIGPEVPVARPLQDVQIPWELTEGLRAMLSDMTAVHLTVVLQTVTHLGSVALGVLLARQAIPLDDAVGALTVTATHLAATAHEPLGEQELFIAETRRVVRRLLWYAQLNR